MGPAALAKGLTVPAVRVTSDHLPPDLLWGSDRHGDYTQVSAS